MTRLSRGTVRSINAKNLLELVTGQLVALVISSPRTAGQLVAKTRRQNEKLTSADHTKYNKSWSNQ